MAQVVPSAATAPTLVGRVLSGGSLRAMQAAGSVRAGLQRMGSFNAANVPPLGTLSNFFKRTLGVNGATIKLVIEAALMATDGH